MEEEEGEESTFLGGKKKIQEISISWNGKENEIWSEAGNINLNS